VLLLLLRNTRNEQARRRLTGSRRRPKTAGSEAIRWRKAVASGRRRLALGLLDRFPAGMAIPIDARRSDSLAPGLLRFLPAVWVAR
jgi:hypothetical protein